MRCLAPSPAATVMLSPEATFDYSIAWSRAKLLGVPIVEAEWASKPDGLAIAPFAIESCRTGARIGGGVPGTRHTLTHRVTLADDRTLTRLLAIEVPR